eukprot:SAG11_NODE_1508_length_4775_cov_1.760693_2_plen_73_part_00
MIRYAAHFIALFRAFMPDLHAHLAAEALAYSDWALPWLRFLLARELPLDHFAGFGTHILRLTTRRCHGFDVI